MRISRNYKAGRGSALTSNMEDDWKKGVEVFVDRLSTQYLCETCAASRLA